uniref:Uncharacterized protein n=1 Tax=Emiliania huxleyi TaxID=2903 RepID=A0A6U9DTP4_EMIHU
MEAHATTRIPTASAARRVESSVSIPPPSPMTTAARAPGRMLRLAAPSHSSWSRCHAAPKLCGSRRIAFRAPISQSDLQPCGAGGRRLGRRCGCGPCGWLGRGGWEDGGTWDEWGRAGGG